MLRYEALLLTIPEITQDESKVLESLIEGVIKTNGASTLSFERWGKYRLAYPVKKNDYGVYFLVRLETKQIGSLLTELQTLFAVKLNDVVMRSIIERLPSTGSLEYQRPHSLEETPSKETGSFFKEGRRDESSHEEMHSSKESHATSDSSYDTDDEEAN